MLHDISCKGKVSHSVEIVLKWIIDIWTLMHMQCIFYGCHHQLVDNYELFVIQITFRKLQFYNNNPFLSIRNTITTKDEPTISSRRVANMIRISLLICMDELISLPVCDEMSDYEIVLYCAWCVCSIIVVRRFPFLPWLSQFYHGLRVWFCFLYLRFSLFLNV